MQYVSYELIHGPRGWWAGYPALIEALFHEALHHPRSDGSAGMAYSENKGEPTMSAESSTVTQGVSGLHRSPAGEPPEGERQPGFGQYGKRRTVRGSTALVWMIGSCVLRPRLLLGRGMWRSMAR